MSTRMTLVVPPCMTAPAWGKHGSKRRWSHKLLMLLARVLRLHFVLSHLYRVPYPCTCPCRNAAASSGGAAACGAGRALLRALGTEPSLENLGPGEGGWARRALGVYQDALAAGCRPRLHVLERLLACLRLPHQRPSALAPLQVQP